MKKYLSFLIVFILLIICGVNYKNLNAAGFGTDAANNPNSYYSVSGPSTAKVGDVVKFKAIRLKNFQYQSLENCPTNVEVKDDGTTCGGVFDFIADPFYLQPTGTTGEYKVINPGTVKVFLTGTAMSFIRNSKTVTLTGTGVSGIGSVKITSSEDIYDKLFPQNSNCAADGDSCLNMSEGSWKYLPMIREFADGKFTMVLGSTMDYNVARSGGTASGGGMGGYDIKSGPRIYDVSDPVNPKLFSGVSFPNIFVSTNLERGTDTPGDYGGNITSHIRATNEDGSVSMVGTNVPVMYWANGYRIKSGVYKGGVSENYEPVSFLNLNGKTIRIYDDYIPDDISSILTSGCNIKSGMSVDSGKKSLAGVPLFQTFCTTNSIPVPSTFPKMRVGRKLITGNEKYIASFERVTKSESYNSTYSIDQMPGDGSDNPRIAIYSVTQNKPVATIDLPKDVQKNFQMSQGIFFRTSAPDGEYFFTIVNTNNSVTGASPTQNNKLYGYKFTYASKKLEQVINGVVLPPVGHLVDAVGIRLGSKIGIATYSNTPVDQEAYMAMRDNSQTMMFKVYMVSDLVSGKVQNVLTNMPDFVIPGGDHNRGTSGYIRLDSTYSGNSAYIYASSFYGGNNQTMHFYAIKLDSTTPSTPKVPKTTPPTTSGCSSAGPYNVLTGELCPVFTTVDCAAGDLFSVLTGKACPKPVTPPITTDPKDCSLVLDIASPEYSACMHDKLLNLQN